MGHKVSFIIFFLIVTNDTFVFQLIHNKIVYLIFEPHVRPSPVLPILLTLISLFFLFAEGSVSLPGSSCCSSSSTSSLDNKPQPSPRQRPAHPQPRNPVWTKRSSVGRTAPSTSRTTAGIARHLFFVS